MQIPQLAVRPECLDLFIEESYLKEANRPNGPKLVVYQHF
jgi:hypothetical protein